LSQDQASALLEAIETAFPEAAVITGYEAPTDAIPIKVEDRHVAAAAVARQISACRSARLLLLLLFVAAP
jgi:hypothetical protein